MERSKKFTKVDARHTAIAQAERLTDKELRLGRKLATYALRKADQGHTGESLGAKTSRLSPSVPNYTDRSIQLARELLLTEGVELAFTRQYFGGIEMGPIPQNYIAVEFIKIHELPSPTPVIVQD